MSNSEINALENVVRTIFLPESCRSSLTSIFEFNLIYESYQKVFESKHTITDDSSALVFSDVEINLILSNQPNPKLTTKNDIDYILYLLNQKPLQ